MKTIVRSAFIFGALALTVSACKKDDKKTVVEEETPIVVPPVAKSTYLYVPGNYQTWKPETADSITSVKDSAGKFFGFIKYDSTSGKNEFKITRKRAWAGGDFGLDGPSVASTNGDPANPVVTGLLKTANSSNIELPTWGVYQLEVDTVAKKIVATKADWGLIGDATAGGWNTSSPMTYNVATKKFEIKNVPLVGGKNIKFRPNNNWAWTDWGTPNADKSYVNGTDLKSKGTDMAITESGNYDITLDLSVKGKAKATITKK